MRCTLEQRGVEQTIYRVYINWVVGRNSALLTTHKIDDLTTKYAPHQLQKLLTVHFPVQGYVKISPRRWIKRSVSYCEKALDAGADNTTGANAHDTGAHKDSAGSRILQRWSMYRHCFEG